MKAKWTHGNTCKVLTQAEAIDAIRIIDKINGPRSNNVFQNKRKAHRDIKVDYLGAKKATSISNALTRAGIAHRRIKSEGGICEWWQVRIATNLAFSVGDARRINRGGVSRKKAAKLSARQRFQFEKRAAVRALAALTFKHPHALRIASDINWTFSEYEGISK